MRIGIDARMSGPAHAGIGRYVENLIKELSKNKNLELVLFVRKSNQAIRQSGNQAIVEADIPHYSLAEQFLMPGIIKKAQVDLMHFPHFNIPVFYTGKYVVTIHDLIKHASRGMETTTRTPWLYWLKYLGYKFVFRQAVKRAVKILVPSQWVKKQLIEIYGLPEDKVVVTYEGVGEKFQHSAFSLPRGKAGIQHSAQVLSKYKISKPFIIYTGSLYPHKNIERLIQSISAIGRSAPGGKLVKISLVISCARSVFWERLKKEVQELDAEKFVNLVGFAPDEELAVLYTQAEAFVFPTLSEGFGLPGLEAMACGCPVVCSDIPVLREVYGEAAEYFDPYDISDMAEKIKRVTGDQATKDRLRNDGLEQVKKYSWAKMAKETLKVYGEVVRKEIAMSLSKE